MARDNLEININFNKDSSLNIISGSLFAYFPETGWEKLANDSLYNFHHGVIKAIDLIAKKEFYLILKNATVEIINNIVSINSFTDKIIYKKVVKKIDLKKEIKLINEKIQNLELLKNIGMQMPQYLELENLKLEYEQLQFIQNLNLEREEQYE
ncbi:MSC_0621 family F1-like ATPase epsilon subunit [Metamycoplasma equirhinis]|uniref:MSC_0621 family F1-like ATPase epsilon subunit n=1 Tax=Metamycoplasma equirhinis TaxID=92402 RepID=UPI0035947C13